MTWAQNAGAELAELDRTIAKDTPLAERRRLVNEAGHFWRSTSWGRKTWGRAARQYLESYGQPKGYGLKKPSPAEGSLL